MTLAVFIPTLFILIYSLLLATLWSLFHKYQFQERDSLLPQEVSRANSKWHSVAFKLRGLSYLILIGVVLLKIGIWDIILGSVFFGCILDPFIAKISLKSAWSHLGTNKTDLKLKSIGSIFSKRSPEKAILFIRILIAFGTLIGSLFL